MPIVPAHRFSEPRTHYPQGKESSMDSWELTKISAAVLSALLLIVGTRTAIEISQSSRGKHVVGFALPTAAPSPDAAAAPTDAGYSFAKVVEALPKGTVEGGQAVFKKCAACHTTDQGGANKVGPNLWNVVNRPKAATAGFAYSEAAKAKASETWTYENLAAFIHSPKGYLPGTKMVFAGVTDVSELADVLVYLRSLSAEPAPLPAQ